MSDSNNRQGGSGGYGYYAPAPSGFYQHVRPSDVLGGGRPSPAGSESGARGGPGGPPPPAPPGSTYYGGDRRNYGGGYNDGYNNYNSNFNSSYGSNKNSGYYDSAGYYVPPPQQQQQYQQQQQQYSNSTTPQQKSRKPPLSRSERAKLQPTVEDVPDEDDLRSGESSVGAEDWTVGGGSTAPTTASSKNSEEGSGGGGNNHGQSKPGKTKKGHSSGKGSSSDYGHSSSSTPRTDPIIERPGRPDPKPVSRPPPTPPPAQQEKKKDKPEKRHSSDRKKKDKDKENSNGADAGLPADFEPRKSTPYAQTYATPKREQVAPVPANVNTHRNGNTASDSDGGRKPTPYAFTPAPKKEIVEEMRERDRAPYSSKPPSGREDPFDVGATPARVSHPYSHTYPSKHSPPPSTPTGRPPLRTQQSSPHTPPAHSDTGRQSSQYSYVNQRTNSSDNINAGNRHPSLRGGSRASTPSGTPKVNVSREDDEREDPIVARLKEAAERRQTAPYSSGPVPPKMTRNHSQSSYAPGQYSNVPQNLQSTGSLKRQPSPAASFSSTTSSGRLVPAASSSPKPAGWTSPPPPPHLATAFESPQTYAAQVAYPPPSPGAYGQTVHAQPPFGYQYQESPASYAAPKATPMWISETEPTGPTCPESSEIGWGVWYHPRYTPRFTVCEGCFRRHIAPTAFAGAFTRSDSAMMVDPPLRSCMFHPVLVKRLWQTLCQAQERQQRAQPVFHQPDANAFYEFADRRSDLVTCASTKGVHPQAAYGHGGKWPGWWATPELPNFLVCEGCFADYLDTASCFEGVSCASPFARRFGPYTMEKFLRQDSGTIVDGQLPMWVCDIGSNMLVKHLLEEANRAGPQLPAEAWDDFVDVVTARLQKTQPCPGQQLAETGAGAVVLGGPRRYFLRRLGGCAMTVCEACHYDLALPAGIQDEFEEIVVEPDEDQPPCHLSRMEFRFPLSVAKETRDFGVFWGAAEWALALPPCTDRGFELGGPRGSAPAQAEWYVYLGGVPGGDYEQVVVDCCPRCFHTLVRPSGFGDRFDRILPGGRLDRSDAAAAHCQALLDAHPFRICSFMQAGSAHWHPPHAQLRFQKTWLKLLEAAHQKELSPLLQFMHSSPERHIPCANTAVILSPRTHTGTRGQRFFSTPGDDLRDTIVACEECFTNHLTGTVFETYFHDITPYLINLLARTPPDDEIIVLCALYSPRQRSILTTCLANVANYHHDTPPGVMLAPLAEASKNRYRTFCSVREELRRLDIQEEMLDLQMGKMRLDVGNGEGIVGGWYNREEEARARERKLDIDARTGVLNGVWRAVE
ncbi:hypothetical protein DFH27DRAFT_607469 [Peziza echinospora]|nr:hypothetical protein DFH27DRAFT_607469 [Peziza echinospora]